MKTMNEIKEMLKPAFHYILMFGIVASLSACGSENREAEYDAEETTTIDEDMNEGSWMNERDGLVTDYRNKMTEWDNKRNEWNKELEGMNATERDEWNNKFSEWEKERGEFETELNEFERSGEEQYGKSKSGLTDRYNELERDWGNFENEFERE